MLKIIVIILFFVSIPLYFLITTVYKKISRKKITEKPFPKEWLDILNKTFPLYKRLPEDLQIQLQKFVQIFINEKNFEGAGGLEMTDLIRVNIAAQACLLLLNRETDIYPHLVSIVVYPAVYKQKRQEIVGQISQEVTCAGESWGQGLVVLAWNRVLGGAKSMTDGHNVVFHEFAHQLDQLDGSADGVPTLDKSSGYNEWGQILGENYVELVEQLNKHKKTLIDSYGATNHAEFFAVSTEFFFEKPHDMENQHPDLYRVLKEYYKQDPVQYIKHHRY
jgi:MtfA peptidase